ncbi:hypothetical protein [Streptomyces sp. NPDC059122]|uniref:hypothetical protein n=1 Tax=Streptomyces sp. NPDC059122 TaxID=3346732 RepID=UPI003676E205
MTSDSPMPSPPFPSPEATLHAAVHGWYEGHIQGEDECPGCDFRGGLPENSNRG